MFLYRRHQIQNPFDTTAVLWAVPEEAFSANTLLTVQASSFQEREGGVSLCVVKGREERRRPS